MLNNGNVLDSHDILSIVSMNLWPKYCNLSTQANRDLAHCFPNGNNYNDQAYSCPRDWRLSASYNPIKGLLKHLKHHDRMVSS